MKGFHASALIPTGLTVESIAHGDTETIITVRSAQRSARCPGCGSASSRSHSRYRRHLSDLPLAGRSVRLHLLA